MKKLFLSIVFVALSAMTFAQQWTSIGKSSPAGPDVKLVSSSEQRIVVDFTLGGFNLKRVETPNGTQQIVSVPKMFPMLEAGVPDLPQFPIPAIIGDRAEMNVSITSSDFTDYENVEIAPSKGNFSRQIDPETVPYTYGEMYNQNAFYPAAQATLETPYILRDFRGQNIMVRPFAYNPMTKTLRVYHHMTIEMKKVSDNGENQKLARKASNKVSPEMKAAYESRFINFKENGAKYNFLTDQGEMLVICPDQYMEAMQPFVDWKNQSGRPTTMVSVAEAGGNNDNAIKSYISNIYNDPSRNLCYILLVGDYADLTPHSMNGGRSDNWFGQLEGNDNYLEAFTGRFSVENATHVATQVNRVIYYERDMPKNETWLDNGIGIAANEGAGQGHFGEADYVHMDYIRDTLMHYTYEEVTMQYSGVGSGTSAAAISADVNNGATIINYCNHGSQTGWAVAGYSMSHVNALTNDYKWPFVWSVACNVGEFQGNCFAEAWLRATNNSTGVPTGAIGGMFSWISQPWQPPMYGQDEMNRILTEWKESDKFNHTLGGASLNGSMFILDAVPNDTYGTHNTWLLFGDPSLMVRTDNPVGMDLSVNPSVLMLGMNELEITAQNTSFGIACLTMDGEVLAIGEIHNGICDLNFEPLSNVGTAKLTVMGYNKVTEMVDIAINPAEGAYLSANATAPIFAPVNQEISFGLNFTNVGVDPTSGTTTVSLSCNDPRLSFLDNTAEFGVLPANEAISLENAFSIILAEDVEDATAFQIDINMTCGDETWTGKVFVTAARANIAFSEVGWQGSYTPGETLSLVALFKNAGHYMATNAVISASCESEYVTFVNDIITIGTIDPEGIGSGVFEITIAENCPHTTVIPVTFTLVADGGVEAQGELVMKNSCNVIFELTDSYGDGWNGNKLRVAFDDGTPTQELTIDDGNSATYTLEIGIGTHVTLSWINGNYGYECSYRVTYEDGTLIYSGQAGSSYQFDCNCGSTSPIVGSYAPVENLSCNVDTERISLTWDAPEDAISYTISRNGVEIGQTEESTFTDQVILEGTYTYCVVANYDGGASVPTCEVVSAEWGIDEQETVFSIYPNPASNTLYINSGNAEYGYEMFNGMGQVMAKGNGQGTMEINVDGMAKGVYFLRLTTGTQVRMEKVVVE